MMRIEDIHPAVWFVLFLVLTIAAVFAASNKLGEISCHERWGRSGLPVQHSFLGGCVVQRKDGTWVPAGAIRELTP